MMAQRGFRHLQLCEEVDRRGDAEEALEAWAAELRRIAEPQPENVVPIRPTVRK
jgi:hypothetical protein